MSGSRDEADDEEDLGAKGDAEFKGKAMESDFAQTLFSDLARDDQKRRGTVNSELCRPRWLCLSGIAYNL